jgi:hypothetical protein
VQWQFGGFAEVPSRPTVTNGNVLMTEMWQVVLVLVVYLLIHLTLALCVIAIGLNGLRGRGLPVTPELTITGKRGRVAGAFCVCLGAALLDIKHVCQFFAFITSIFRPTAS